MNVNRRRRLGLLVGVATTLCGLAALANDEPRLVALSPALARIVTDLGLKDRLVGVSRWTQMDELRDVPTVGDAGFVDAEQLLSVRPTHILTQQTAADALEAARRIDPDLRVNVLSIESVGDILNTVRLIGGLTGRGDAAEALIADWPDAWTPPIATPTDGPRVLFVMGTDRPYAARSGSFLDELMRGCGAVNAGADIPGTSRWTATDAESVIAAEPDVLVCQVSGPHDVEHARAYWASWFERAGRTNVAIRITADTEWTIPSMRLAQRFEQARALFAAP